MTSGAVTRRALEPTEAGQLFWGIDRSDAKLFGIRHLASLELDSLFDAPRGVPWTRQMRLLDYAAWRARDGFVRALLNAGADATEGHVPLKKRLALPPAYAVWTARAAARMRQLGAMTAKTDATCSCGGIGTLCFSPCHHACCPACVWCPFSTADESAGEYRPVFTCPSCNVEYHDPFVNSDGSRHSGKSLPPAATGDGAWTCRLCFYTSRAARLHCRNCGTEPLDESQVAQLGQAAKPAVQSNCWSGAVARALSCAPHCLLNALESRARARRCREAFRRWQALPEDDVVDKTKREKPAFRALSANDDAREHLGFSRGQRSARLLRSVARGDARRVEAILEAGADVEVANEYGQTPLFLASWEGCVDVIAVLLRWGGDANKPSNGAILPADAAAARGHDRALAMLRAVGGRGGNSAARPHPPLGIGQVTTIPLVVPAGGFAYYIDGAFTDAFLDRLEALWKSLPVAVQDAEQARQDGFAKQLLDRSRMNAAPERSYFCDAEGWLQEGIETAMLGCSAGSVCSTAFAHMRFLHYAQVGGFLPAHFDLPRTDASGRKSSHTLLLYLSGVENGGETVLLERLEQTAAAVARVRPVRGRLLIYPHDTPHRAEPVEAPPKLLLRGEMR